MKANSLALATPTPTSTHISHIPLMPPRSDRKKGNKVKPVLVSVVPEDVLVESVGSNPENTIAENTIYSATRPIIGNAVRTGVAVLMQNAVTGEGVPQDALSIMLADLYNVPENRPILDVLAWIADHLAFRIELLNNNDRNNDRNKNLIGQYVSAESLIWIRYDPNKEDESRSTLMHEITHVVAHFLYHNSGKTYFSGEGKDDYAAIQASRSAEAVTCTELELVIAGTINEPFTDGGYDHHKEWKSERRVRIPELLSRDYHSKAILEEKYSEEWRGHTRFMDLCKDFLREAEQLGDVGWELRAFDDTIAPGNEPKQGSLDTSANRFGVANWVINLAIMKAFGNVRGIGHLEKIKDAVWPLSDMFSASPFCNFLHLLGREQLEALVTPLSVHYKKCFTRSIWTHKRQYHFKKIDEEALRTHVERSLEELCVEFVIDRVAQSQNGIVPDVDLLREAFRTHPLPWMMPEIWVEFINLLTEYANALNGQVSANCINAISNECITYQIRAIVDRIQFPRPSQLYNILGENDLRTQLRGMNQDQWYGFMRRLEVYYHGCEEDGFPTIGKKALRDDLREMIEDSLKE